MQAACERGKKASRALLVALCREGSSGLLANPTAPLTVITSLLYLIGLRTITWRKKDLSLKEP